MSATAAWARMGATLALVCALDQGSKALVVSRLARGESVNVFLGLDITNVRNSGIAFGFLAGANTVVAVLIGVALVALVGYFVRNARVRMLWLPVGALLGGALGNLIDRTREGKVIDFIDPIAWPAFNLADTAIVLGIFGLLYVAEARSAVGAAGG